MKSVWNCQQTQLGNIKLIDGDRYIDTKIHRYIDRYLDR